MNGLYVFALAGDRCEPFERAGHVIEIIKTGGVYAAVERVDRPPTVSEQALRDQHEVIAHLHAKLDALLPARFGAFLDARELESVVGQRRDAILEALQLVRGRSQMTIRLLGGEAAQPAAPALAGSRAVVWNGLPREPQGTAVRTTFCTQRRVRSRSQSCRRGAV